MNEQDLEMMKLIRDALKSLNERVTKLEKRVED